MAGEWAAGGRRVAGMGLGAHCQRSAWRDRESLVGDLAARGVSAENSDKVDVDQDCCFNEVQLFISLWPRCSTEAATGKTTVLHVTLCPSTQAQLYLLLPCKYRGRSA